jgi:uncharacterized DUF497 family protein
LTYPTRFDCSEERFITLGLLEGRVVVFVHAETDDLTRVISAKKATRNEESIYFEEIAD